MAISDRAADGRDRSVQAADGPVRKKTQKRKLRTAVKSIIPRRLHVPIWRVLSFSPTDWLAARVLDRRAAQAGLRLALYDPELDILKMPADSDEILDDLRHGVIADAAPWLLKIDPWVPKGGIVLDVGAYRGVTAQWFARKARFVYAFEAFPPNAACIERALRAKRVENVAVVNAAAFNRPGTSDFYVCRITGNNSLGPVRTSKIVDRIRVSTVTLDDYCRERDIESVDFLKIDVEGFEREVLEGADRLLRERRIRAVLFEVSRVPLESLGKSPADAHDFLRSKGYKVFNLDGVSLDAATLHACEQDDFLALPG